MKRFMLSLLASALLVASSLALSPIETAHKAALHIRQEVLTDSATCSAEAIGSQAILTATHCELPTDSLQIEGRKGDIQIVGRIRDGNDHSIYLLKNVHFDTYVDVSLNDPLAQGEDVFMWGNPGSWTSQFRKGYITGINQSSALEKLFGLGEPDRIMFDMICWHGDSGSGIFNVQGQEIAVLTGSETPSVQGDSQDAIRLTFAFRFGFKASDLSAARAFSAADDPVSDSK